jgi:acetylornithine/N-succinyldiaminopimelate aminotransferase
MNTATSAAPREHLAQVFAQYPFEAVGGDDVWITTRDGRRILDCYGGHAVAALGYGHPRWLEALERQARSLSFQTNAVPLAVRERAARRLVEFSGLPLDTVFFVNSGAEANENALKLACLQTGRSEVLALEHGWHGRTAAAAAVTWGARDKWYGFPRAPFDVRFISRSDPAGAAAITERTACVIVEPVQGLAGAYPVPSPVLAALRQRCTDQGAVLIFDEVQCGVGRTGRPFAAHRSGVVPDMLTTAKALGAGFPVAALLLARPVANQLKLEQLGTTFGGGPIACALVETVIDVIESERLLENVARVSRYITKSCQVGPVVGIQGEGFLLGLKLTRPAREVQRELLDQGIFAGGAADPNILRLLPAYTFAEAHVALLARALSELAA